MRNALLACVAVCLLAACARATLPDSRGARAASATLPLITRLIVDYTPAAAKQAADEMRFDEESLNKAIGRGLATQGLADLANAAVIGVVAIEVDEFDVSASSNVVLMGRVASRGVLGATVRVRQGSGTEIAKFHVRADLPLSIVRNDTDRNQLEILYNGFTNLIVDELTGRTRGP